MTMVRLRAVGIELTVGAGVHKTDLLRESMDTLPLLKVYMDAFAPKFLFLTNPTES